MSFRWFVTAGTLLAFGCAPDRAGKLQKKFDNDNLQSGYLKVGEDQQLANFTPEGEFARLDECSKVPLSSISSEPKPSMQLTTEKGVDLWRKGIIPYALVNNPPYSQKDALLKWKNKGDMWLKPRWTEIESCGGESLEADWIMKTKSQFRRFSFICPGGSEFIQQASISREEEMIRTAAQASKFMFFFSSDTSVILQNRRAAIQSNNISSLSSEIL